MLSNFLTAVIDIAPPVGKMTYGFSDGNGDPTGFVQIIPECQNLVVIHRFWTLRPRCGNGSVILNALCELADRHGISLKLKALPLGAKPYPFSRDELVAWYTRHGFEGKRRKMLRIPRTTALISAATAESQAST